VAKQFLWDKEGKDVLSFLVEKRKISEEVVRFSNFGFIPSFYAHQLSGKIVIPIYDGYDNLVYLSTKSIVIPKGDKGHFWHEDFEKRHYLYGLNISKSSIMKENEAILVEGEMDVAFLCSMGINIAVAICGTAFSIFQASLLLRYCSKVYIVFDGDDAGRKALTRVLSIYQDCDLDAYGVKYVPVYLPSGSDPDDYIIENGKESFMELLQRSSRSSW